MVGSYGAGQWIKVSGFCSSSHFAVRPMTTPRLREVKVLIMPDSFRRNSSRNIPHSAHDLRLCTYLKANMTPK